MGFEKSGSTTEKLRGRIRPAGEEVGEEVGYNVDDALLPEALPESEPSLKMGSEVIVNTKNGETKGKIVEIAGDDSYFIEDASGKELATADQRTSFRKNEIRTEADIDRQPAQVSNATEQWKQLPEARKQEYFSLLDQKAQIEQQKADLGGLKGRIMNFIFGKEKKLNVQLQEIENRLMGHADTLAIHQAMISEMPARGREFQKMDVRSALGASRQQAQEQVLKTQSEADRTNLEEFGATEEAFFQGGRLDYSAYDLGELKNLKTQLEERIHQEDLKQFAEQKASPRLPGLQTELEAVELELNKPERQQLQKVEYQERAAGIEDITKITNGKELATYFLRVEQQIKNTPEDFAQIPLFDQKQAIEDRYGTLPPDEQKIYRSTIQDYHNQADIGEAKKWIQAFDTETGELRKDMVPKLTLDELGNAKTRLTNDLEETMGRFQAYEAEERQPQKRGYGLKEPVEIAADKAKMQKEIDRIRKEIKLVDAQIKKVESAN